MKEGARVEAGEAGAEVEVGEGLEMEIVEKRSCERYEGSLGCCNRRVRSSLCPDTGLDDVILATALKWTENSRKMRGDEDPDAPGDSRLNIVLPDREPLADWQSV